MINIYTDGSCIGNPGPGGWAVLVVSDQSLVSSDQYIVFSGGEKMTTNNVMELTAAIKALIRLFETFGGTSWQWNESDRQEGFFASEAVREKTIISTQAIVITDSSYVKLGITDWMVTWKRRQRRRAKGGKLVENVQLRKELDALASCFSNLERQRTKAHVGTELNERVDQLARDEAMQLL